MAHDGDPAEPRFTGRESPRFSPPAEHPRDWALRGGRWAFAVDQGETWYPLFSSRFDLFSFHVPRIDWDARPITVTGVLGLAGVRTQIPEENLRRSFDFAAPVLFPPRPPARHGYGRPRSAAVQPDRLRSIAMLCDIEGMSKDAARRNLGITGTGSEGTGRPGRSTLRSQLEQARTMLWHEGALPWAAWQEGRLPQRWWAEMEFIDALERWHADGHWTRLRRLRRAA